MKIYNKYTMIVCVAVLSISGFALTGTPSSAQLNVNNTPPTTASAAVEKPPIILVPQEISFEETLFFSDREITSIRQAMAGLNTRIVDEDDETPIPERRLLELAGLLYDTPDKWTIWLNGHRVTPTRLLPEIVEIEVNETHIHLKWFDIGLKDVIKIKLHPHQVYDIQTGVLLPGSG